jgi:hypothetical protein
MDPLCYQASGSGSPESTEPTSETDRPQDPELDSRKNDLAEQRGKKPSETEYLKYLAGIEALRPLTHDERVRLTRIRQAEIARKAKAAKAELGGNEG